MVGAAAVVGAAPVVGATEVGDGCGSTGGESVKSQPDPASSLITVTPVDAADHDVGPDATNTGGVALASGIVMSNDATPAESAPESA